MKTTLQFLLWSFLTGHLLLIFSWSDFSLFRYVYSLGALFIGIYFFRQFESKGLRIGYILMSLFFYLVLTVFYVALGEIPILKLVPPGAKLEQPM